MSSLVSGIDFANPNDKDCQEKKMASKGKENRIVTTMACTVCRQRNYTTSKNKKNNPERLELRKFCPTCRVHTAHRETK